MKGLKEDIEQAKNELDELKENYGIVGLYREIIRDLKKSSKRNFIIILILLFMLFATNIGWLIYESQFELVDTTTQEQTIEDVDNAGDIFQEVNK
jgi:hypothetical protein